MTYQELVEQVREAYKNADASSIKEHVAFQFNIEGEGEGAFYLEIADGKINIEPYEYYDRDVLITTSAETLLKIGTGKLDPVLAYTIKKIRVEGDLGKALLLKSISAKVEVSDEAKAAESALEKNAPNTEEAVEAGETKAEEETADANEAGSDGMKEAVEATANVKAVQQDNKPQNTAGQKWPNRKKKKR